MVNVKDRAVRSQQNIVIVQIVHYLHLVTDEFSFRHFVRLPDSAAGVRLQSGRANRLRKGRYRYLFLHPDDLSFRSHFDVKFKTVDFELGFIKFS